MGCFKRTALKYVYYLGWNGLPAQVGCMRQALGPGALGKPRGSGWRGRWEGESGWGTHVNPWLIHVNVWQNPLQIKKRGGEERQRRCHIVTSSSNNSRWDWSSWRVIEKMVRGCLSKEKCLTWWKVAIEITVYQENASHPAEGSVGTFLISANPHFVRIIIDYGHTTTFATLHYPDPK